MYFVYRHVGSKKDSIPGAQKWFLNRCVIFLPTPPRRQQMLVNMCLTRYYARPASRLGTVIEQYFVLLLKSTRDKIM